MSLVKVTTGGLLLFTGFSIYKSNETFYEKYLMPLIRLLPPDTRHKVAVFGCKYKLFSPSNNYESSVLKTKFFNHHLTNPIGIAAGFDKHCEAVEGLKKIGFGFIEIGSVTPVAQPRIPPHRVCGLADTDEQNVVWDRLYNLKHKKTINCVLGVNLDKNKTSHSVLEDYVRGVKVYGQIADYLVINISTSGKKDLEKLVEAVMEVRNNLPTNNKVPILLKISPDTEKKDLQDIANVVNKKTCRIDGLIVSYTDYRDNRNIEKSDYFSRTPLRLKSTQTIADIYHLTKGKVPIIGVGGISSGQDAFEKLEAGASFLQFYTAFIYHGPPIVTKIKKELVEIITLKGYKNVEDVVGKNNKNYISK